MTVYLIFNDTDGYTAAANGDLHIVQSGYTLAHTGNAFDIGTLANITVNVAGTIVSAADGIASIGGSGANISIAATGSVFGDSDGISLSGSGHEVVNYGSVTGYGDSGIEFYGDNNVGANHGSIHGVYGFYLSGDNGLVTNSGTISATYTGMDVTGNANIASNTGLIESGYIGVFISGNAGETTTFLNAGMIVGDTYAIRNGPSDDTVRNTGTLVGDVDLRAGNDVFDNRGGTVQGTVWGDTGDDLFIIDSATDISEDPDEGMDEVQSLISYALGANIETLTLLGAESLNGTGNELANTLTGNAGANDLRGLDGDDTIDGLAGDDAIFGGEGGDSLTGGFGNDSLYGGDGGDVLAGGNGDDMLLGKDGNDTLKGWKGDDSMVGGAGNDSLLGSYGNDTLDGGEGKDTLNGGDGDDLMTGGLQADTFVFTDGFGNDTITDFAASWSSEKIDLSGVVNITNYSDLSNNHMSQVGSDVVIDDLAGNTITLENVSLGDLDATDFIF